MRTQHATFEFSDADQTARRGRELGQTLTPGDVILLTGEVGAGKTHFARALIQSLLLHPEDVPSPTFTLIQTYQTRLGDIWHADLYRLTSTHEIEELGLTDAFDEAVCLIEWPDRLGEFTPETALSLDLAPGSGEDSRLVRAQWADPKWNEKVAIWQT